MPSVRQAQNGKPHKKSEDNKGSIYHNSRSLGSLRSSMIYIYIINSSISLNEGVSVHSSHTHKPEII